jgi:hypothetical protein
MLDATKKLEINMQVFKSDYSCWRAGSHVLQAKFNDLSFFCTC